MLLRPGFMQSVSVTGCLSALLEFVAGVHWPDHTHANAAESPPYRAIDYISYCCFCFGLRVSTYKLPCDSTWPRHSGT